MAPRVLPLPLVLLALFSAPTFSQSAMGPPPAPSAQSDEMRRGVAHFDRAFYELTPHKRDLEALGFDLAIASLSASSRSAQRLPRRTATWRAFAWCGRIPQRRRALRRADGAEPVGHRYLCARGARLRGSR